MNARCGLFQGLNTLNMMSQWTRSNFLWYNTQSFYSSHLSNCLFVLPFCLYFYRQVLYLVQVFRLCSPLPPQPRETEGVVHIRKSLSSIYLHKPVHRTKKTHNGMNKHKRAKRLKKKKHTLCGKDKRISPTSPYMCKSDRRLKPGIH